MIEWVLKAWRVLAGEITAIKYGSCMELPLHHRKLGNTDPVEGIQDENVCIEGIPGLSIDPYDSDEDNDSIVSKCK